MLPNFCARPLKALVTLGLALVSLTLVLLSSFVVSALAADPIRIGLSLSLTGPTSPAGKQVLTGLEI